MIDLKGKIAVITGAGRGIGYHLGKALADCGATVYGIDISFPEHNYNITQYTLDLRHEVAFGHAHQIIEGAHNRLDILINNAGITRPSHSEEYSYGDWRDTFQLNVDVPFLLSQAMLPLLRQSDSASIINVTSLNAKLAFPDNPAYVASKSALAGLTRSMALDYGKFGVRVNALAPGYIKTKMTGESWSNPDKRKQRSERTMVERWGTPEDLVGPMLFLASDMSSYVTGQSLFVDGGWSVRGL